MPGNVPADAILPTAGTIQMIDMCSVCLAIIYNRKIPTRTDNNIEWNSFQYSDCLAIQRGTLKIWRKDTDSRLPMVAMTTVRGTRYCGEHIPPMALREVVW